MDIEGYRGYRGNIRNAGEGATLQLDGTDGDAAVLEFNSLRSIDPDTVNVVGVTKASSRGTQDFYIGTTNEYNFGKNYMLAGIRKGTSTTKWAMLTFGASAWTSVASSTDSNTNWNVHQMIRTSTNCVHKVNGTTSTTHTTDLTTLKQSPCLECGNNGAGSQYTKCRWFEVYQT
jgi:hypothetical protein